MDGADGEGGVDAAEEVDKGRRADAAEGGEHEGEEVDVEVLEAGGVLGGLVRGLGEEDGGCVGDGGGEVSGEERAGEGGVEGEGAGAGGVGEAAVDLAVGGGGGGEVDVVVVEGGVGAEGGGTRWRRGRW